MSKFLEIRPRKAYIFHADERTGGLSGMVKHFENLQTLLKWVIYISKLILTTSNQIRGR
jgi:hypothetical protein